ncbi:hypothetical protein, partial [Robiginitalea sp.]|uniref:hypothetical protein n=1 Tax=Robiginitalea sp. TaxID=1902411 RepID=UPI003C612B4E
MKKYIYILFASLALLASCEEDLVIYDGETSQTYGRFGSTIVELPVVFDSSAETTIPIELSTLSETDRTVSVELVSTGAENEADPTQYDFPSQVVVPANSYSGDLVFTGIDNGIEIGETKTVTLQITDISGAPDASLDGLSSTTISMFQVCPVESDFFIGDYELTTTAVGIFGSTVFPQGVVTIEQGESSNDARSFTAQIYPDLGTFDPIQFNFTLVCGTVVVSAGQVTGVGCGSSTTLG